MDLKIKSVIKKGPGGSIKASGQEISLSTFQWMGKHYRIRREHTIEVDVHPRKVETYWELNLATPDSEVFAIEFEDPYVFVKRSYDTLLLGWLGERYSQEFIQRVVEVLDSLIL